MNQIPDQQIIEYLQQKFDLTFLHENFDYFLQEKTFYKVISFQYRDSYFCFRFRNWVLVFHRGLVKVDLLGDDGKFSILQKMYLQDFNLSRSSFEPILMESLLTDQNESLREFIRKINGI